MMILGCLSSSLLSAIHHDFTCFLSSSSLTSLPLYGVVDVIPSAASQIHIPPPLYLADGYNFVYFYLLLPMSSLFLSSLHLLLLFVGYDEKKMEEGKKIEQYKRRNCRSLSNICQIITIQPLNILLLHQGFNILFDIRYLGWEAGFHLLNNFLHELDMFQLLSRFHDPDDGRL